MEGQIWEFITPARPTWSFFSEPKNCSQKFFFPTMMYFLSFFFFFYFWEPTESQSRADRKTLRYRTEQKLFFSSVDDVSSDVIVLVTFCRLFGDLSGALNLVATKIYFLNICSKCWIGRGQTFLRLKNENLRRFRLKHRNNVTERHFTCVVICLLDTHRMTNCHKDILLGV